MRRGPEPDLRATTTNDVCSLPEKHLGPHRFDTKIITEGICASWSGSYYRDRRPCPGCGLVAIRTIWPKWGAKGTEGVSFCTACKLESSAITHENTARKLRAQATAIRNKRASRRIRNMRTE